MQGLHGNVDKAWVLEHPGPATQFPIHETVTRNQDARDISQAVATLNLIRHQCAILTTGGSLDLIYLAHQNGSADLLDVGKIFPNGALSIRVTCIPGTPIKLDNDWRIIVSRSTLNSPVNGSIKSLYNINWMGNMVLCKYGVSGSQEDVLAGDLRFLIPFVCMWINYMQNLRVDFLLRDANV